MPISNAIRELQTIASVLKEVEKQVQENRKKFDDSQKDVKDFRRIFDQDSSRMNKAIFEDAAPEAVHLETLRTIAILVEILSRVQTK